MRLMEKKIENIEDAATEQDLIQDDNPLANEQREKFCQLYAGELWGNAGEAYIAAGYRAKNKSIALCNSLRLLRKEGISERIRFLREARLIELESDKLWIAKQRKEIAERAEKETVRLHALKDLEKGLGLIPDGKRGKDRKRNIKIVFNGREDEGK